MLLKQNSTEPPPTKRRSTFSTLFIPDIGSSIRPLRDTVTAFVNLVAMLFVMNGLFPRDHPALERGSKVRLTLPYVIRTGWDRLSFTEKGLPQVLFFFGAVGIMIFTALIAFIAFFSMFTGHAHAAVVFFTAPGGNGPASVDLAQQFINYLFLGLPINGLMAENGSSILTSNIIQCGLYTALGFYSDAILIIAAMVLFYHLAWMTVETAHHGQVMGQRGNQVWAPIRLVFAVGLLVPTGGGGPVGCANPSVGLNSGQIIAIAIAQWGSGMASQVWFQFAEALKNDNFTYVPPPVAPVRKMVLDMVNMYACEWAFNSYVQTNYGNPLAIQNSYPVPGLAVEDPQGIDPLAPPAPAKAPWYVVQANGAKKYTFTNTYFEDLHMCGSYSIPEAPQYFDPSFVGQTAYGQGIVQAIFNAHQATFAAAQNSFQQAGQLGVSYFVPNTTWNPNYDNEGGPTAPPAGADINKLVKDYQEAVTAAVDGAVVGNATDVQAAVNTFEQGGWITAGAWFNRIARMQDDVFNAGEDGLVVTQPPMLGSVVILNSYYNTNGDTDQVDDATLVDIYKKVHGHLIEMNHWFDTFTDLTVAPVGPTLQQQEETSAEELPQGGPLNTCSAKHAVDCLFWIIDHVAQLNGVWHATPTAPGQQNLLGIQFTGANPLAEVAAFGQANLNTAYTLLDYGIGLAGVSSILEGATKRQEQDDMSMTKTVLHGVGALGTAAGSLMMLLGGVFFTMGFLMGFYVPLVPFISFMFGALTWVVAMLEAVIAVPLIALAHLNPEGDGLPGSTGKAAYFFIFQVFLRPTLMVFGLLCGLLIFFIGVSIMNALFSVAVAGTGGLNHGHYTAARLMYSVIYVLLVVSMASNAFQLITRLPDTAMQWMGANGIGGAEVGNSAVLERDLGAVQALVTNTGVGQLAGGVRGAGNAIGGAINPFLPGGGGGRGRTGGGPLTRA
ncbi:MAG: DotA/TraY family protein [Pseudomonadota bacterium]|nr:DotA/TraY family protein [Pseudomonadota bacterium]